jgi:hypothetical protein
VLHRVTPSSITTGKRPWLLMVVGSPTPRVNELYGAHEAKLSEIAADVAREMVVRAQRDDFSVESDPGVAVCVREVRATEGQEGGAS